MCVCIAQRSKLCAKNCSLDVDIVCTSEWNWHGKSQHNGSGACWVRIAHYIAFYLEYLGVICAIVYNDFSLCHSSPFCVHPTFFPGARSLWLFTFHLGFLDTNVSRIRMSARITIRDTGKYDEWTFDKVGSGDWTSCMQCFTVHWSKSKIYVKLLCPFMIARFWNATRAEKSELSE